MAKCRELCVVDHSVSLEPPAAEERCYERSDETSDINEYIEDLETGVTLVLGFCECLRAYLCSISLEVIVHLTNDCLKVALEKSVTECDKEEGYAGHRKKPADVA